MKEIEQSLDRVTRMLRLVTPSNNGTSTDNTPSIRCEALRYDMRVIIDDLNHKAKDLPKDSEYRGRIAEVNQMYETSPYFKEAVGF